MTFWAQLGQKRAPVEKATTASPVEVEKVLPSALPPFPPSEDGQAEGPGQSTMLPVDHFGTSIYVKSWVHNASSLPPIVLVHDVGEHADCYDAAATALYESGYSVYTFDWRGHGRSGWQFGHAPSFHILVKDLLQVAAWARYHQGGRSPVLIGQGVGALMVLEFTKSYAQFCRAAVLSAPCLELQTSVGALQGVMLKLLAELIPRVKLWQPLLPRFSSGRHTTHPIAGESGSVRVKFPGVTAGLAYELVLAMKRSETRFIQFDGSILILCPERDAVCNYQQLKKNAAIHVDHNLEIIDLPELGHGVLTDDEGGRTHAVGAILDWLRRLHPIGPATATEPQ